MADCDMCGKKDVSTVTALVEGVEMSVCSSCARYGERKVDHSKRFSANVTRDRKRRQHKVDPDDNKRIIPEFAKVIKDARESKGLTQEQLADRINEKESLLHKFESGSMTPNFKVARKLERFFSLSLIEDVDDVSDIETPNTSDGPSQGLTMGDIMKQAMDKKK
ncbi:MAG: multiprotein bridging factor aMBF1 [Nanoarchaeota archaeon]